MKNWFRKYLMPIVIGGVLFGLIIFVDMSRLEWWAKPVFDFLNRQAIVLSAAAAVTLAAAAVWAVRTTADQTRTMIAENRRIRDEDKELDFRRRTLDEIVNWVIDVNKRCIPPTGIGEEAYKEWCRGITSSLGSEGKWALRNSNILGSEFNEKINNLLGKIITFNDWIKKIGESSKYSDKEAQEILSKYFVNTLESTDEVLDKALKIRSDQRL